jgi:SAM-dependent methyltransferase
MTAETTELLAHYLARGREPWNVSLEASWLDYELRAWVRPRLPSGWPVRACNIGIGVGLWDDWLGHELGVAITSVDTDHEICRTFAMRQRREGHPFPARVRCGDPRDGILGRERFDVVTIVGSTLAETGDRPGLERAARAALVPSGVLLVADVGNREPPCDRDVELRRLGEMWITFREEREVTPCRAGSSI